jgi:1-deoxy-D-xylulose-5-phosphate reductoisomerase
MDSRLMGQLITVLGATGSIGQTTLAVVAQHPQHWQIFALTAKSQTERLYQQCLAVKPRFAVLSEPDSAASLQNRLKAAGLTTEVLAGDEGLRQVATAEPVTTVIAAIVGAAGLLPTLAAVQAGKRVLLANKEALVMAGPLLMAAVQKSGAQLLPIDSEHSGVFQCLAGQPNRAVSRIVLTASGGACRDLPLDQLAAVTPEQACAHPNWSMGKKISVDSATMMNKGLELIEACWLFAMEPATVDLVLHPQSIVHALVAFVDGSMLAQLSQPDMQIAIAYGLAWPDQRLPLDVPPLDLVAQGQLNFQAICQQRYPCLELARQAIISGGSATTVLNAANEVAVMAFLNQQIRFTQIAELIARVLDQIPTSQIQQLADILTADKLARQAANQQLKSISK